ncbi:hypothetical protein ACFQDM_09760 [Ponticaulis profundi]|uniref:Uncharacterized protein n=1 Tax=Ponticaulis profundi TaxID=2665222 RepID=A0ABW1SAQ7_9PROT
MYDLMRERQSDSDLPETNSAAFSASEDEIRAFQIHLIQLFVKTERKPPHLRTH